MSENFTFFHISKNVESPKQLVDNFSHGLKPIGSDTADSEQKQAGGLYFWANRENADRHIGFLTGTLEGGRQDEVSDKVGEVQFMLPDKKISFPDFRLDIERNEIRARFVEGFMFEHLESMNQSSSLRQLGSQIKLKDDETLLGFTKEVRKYAENKPNSREGECLCLRVLKGGKEEIRRPGVEDVEKVSVWLAENNSSFKDKYSKFLRFIFKDNKQCDKLGLAFKYCGKDNIPVSRIMLHEKKDGYKNRVLYDKEMLSRSRISENY